MIDLPLASAPQSVTVSRKRYDRERAARREAEDLLDERSRALWDAHQALKSHAETLEATVAERTVELQDALIRAEASSKAKSVFLAAMSHELRTPLNGVLGMAEALQTSGLDADQQKMAETIQNSGQVLLSVFNDILDISQIEAGAFHLDETDFDLGAAVQSTCRDFTADARGKGIALAWNIAPKARVFLHSDESRLRQVLRNLLSNAVKFTTEGRIDLKVDADHLAEGRALVTFEVADTGIGIAQDKHLSLFAPFQQADTSASRRFDGTGLGLSISRHICRQMGGDISVQSTPGRGSVFTATVHTTMVGPAVTSTAPAHTAPHDPRLDKRWKILLVEDNKTNQLVFTQLIKAFDWDISVAHNGVEAVEFCAHRSFDLVLMDINMPYLDGVEATQQIRAQEQENARKPVPIVALTANSMADQIENYLASGMTGFLPKPLKKKDLLRVIAEQLDQSNKGAASS